LESLKEPLRRESYAKYELTRKTIFSEKLTAVTVFHGLFWGIKLDLAVPTYQKYVNTLSHDSGDVKNIENELITKKIQVFETRRKIYNSISFY
jgi:hypothetical protein